MIYLLDVNALIALGINQHQFHSRIETWLSSFAEVAKPSFATCSITELGFIRIVSQISAYNISLEQAREVLSQLKDSQDYDFQFIADANDISHLPNWVKLPKHTTDGHLAELARANGAELATFDEHILDSFLIP